MTYRNRSNLKRKSLRYLDTEEMIDRFQQAAASVGWEPQPLIRAVLQRFIRNIEQAANEQQQQAFIPKRKADFIEVDPKGRIEFSDDLRLCRAA